MSKVGTTQENVRKALDIKSSIESTVCRIQKLNVVDVTDSWRTTAIASHGKQLLLSELWVLVSQHLLLCNGEKEAEQLCC